MIDFHPPRDEDLVEPVSAKVVRTVAAYANKEPTELPPLHETVETDALDTIFATRTDGKQRANGKVVFLYAGLQVTVRADESVDVERPDSSEE